MTILARALALSEGGGDGGGNAPTITVQVDGKDITVPAPKDWLPKAEVDAKYVPMAAHNDQMARLRQKADAFKDRKSADELLDDPEFRTKAATKWGLTPNTDFQEQLKRAKDEIVERHVKPLEQKHGKAVETITSLRQRDLRGQILQAAAGMKIEDRYLKPPTKGGTPLIVAMLAEQFGFDEQHGEWFAKDGKGGFVFSSENGEIPYQTVTEYLGRWIAADGKEFTRNERQQGAEVGAGKTIPGQVGKEIRVTQEQAKDTRFMRPILEKAEKEGLTVVTI